MLARIWGCRGSIAAPGPKTLRYGGNTSCVELRLSDNRLVVFDAGTGIVPLAQSLAEEQFKEVHLMLTHLHLDHLQGIGFFEPMLREGVEMHVWGPTSAMKDLRALIEKYLSPPLFPIQLLDITSGVVYHDNPFGEWEVAGARFQAQPVTHQGPTVGYRVEEMGRSLTYIPDHEPGRGVDLVHRGREWISGFDLAYQTDLLMHDCQYFEEEYGTRTGWGHSSVSHAVTFAKLAEVKQLVMFHHDPLHDDDELEELQTWAAEMWGPEGNPPVLASEGMEIELDEDGVRIRRADPTDQSG